MAEKYAQRRLAGILAVDVVGYSRLMGEDEEGTLEALKAHRNDWSTALRDTDHRLPAIAPSVESKR